MERKKLSGGVRPRFDSTLRSGSYLPFWRRLPHLSALSRIKWGMAPPYSFLAVSPLQKFHRWDDLVAGHSEIAAPSNVKLTIKPFTRQVLKHRPPATNSVAPRGGGPAANKVVMDTSD
eukprot:sb/3476469/